MTNQLNEDNIRVAAYYIWEQAGRPEGQEKECWIKACEQLFAAGSNNNTCCKKSTKSCKTSATKSATKKTAVKATACSLASKSVKAQSIQKTKKAMA